MMQRLRVMILKDETHVEIRNEDILTSPQIKGFETAFIIGFSYRPIDLAYGAGCINSIEFGKKCIIRKVGW